jgi:hypothetical protein
MSSAPDVGIADGVPARGADAGSRASVVAASRMTETSPHVQRNKVWLIANHPRGDKHVKNTINIGA